MDPSVCILVRSQVSLCTRPGCGVGQNDKHTHTRTHTRAHTSTHTHTHTSVRRHTRTRAHPQPYNTQTRTHAHTHTHTHTHPRLALFRPMAVPEVVKVLDGPILLEQVEQVEPGRIGRAGAALSVRGVRGALPLCRSHHNRLPPPPPPGPGGGAPRYRVNKSSLASQKGAYIYMPLETSGNQQCLTDHGGVTREHAGSLLKPR